MSKLGMQNLSLLNEIVFTTAAITYLDTWNSQISLQKWHHKNVIWIWDCLIHLFFHVFVHILAHQHPSKMTTRTVLINLGPWDSLINCVCARTSRVVERVSVTPVSPC